LDNSEAMAIKLLAKCNWALEAAANEFFNQARRFACPIIAEGQPSAMRRIPTGGCVEDHPDV
jgi:hypothetical protein